MMKRHLVKDLVNNFTFRAFSKMNVTNNISFYYKEYQLNKCIQARVNQHLICSYFIYFIYKDAL